MESVTFSEEQFKELITAIRPGSLALPTPPEEGQRDRSVALEVLRVCEQYLWGGETEFTRQLRELAKSKI